MAASSSGPPGGGQVPSFVQECAGNIARWFPEVLLTLGAEDLEAMYEPGGARIVEGDDARTIEVSLQARGVPELAEPPAVRRVPITMHDPSPPKSRAEVLDSLDKLTSDLEVLAEQVAQANRQQVLSNIDAATDNVFALAAQLQQLNFAPQQAPAPAAAPAKAPMIMHIASDDCSSETPEERPPLAGDAKDRTPQSARGDRQVRQGDAEGTHHGMGRSRGQRTPLRIAITKVQKLRGEPSSPKLVRRSKVRGWGPQQHQRRQARGDSFDDNGPDAIKERIEKQLTQMFGCSARGARGAAAQWHGPRSA